MNASKEQESKYMIIEALEDNFTVTLNGRNAFVEYSIDGEIWNTLNVGQTTSTINSGEQLLFKGKHTQTGLVYLGFKIKKQCNLKGTCMALLGDEYAIKNKTLKNRNFAFSGLFVGCTGILSVDKNFLPATTLSNSCYEDMFSGCTSLVNAPELPASTLTQYCYSSMFEGCTKLNYIKMLATDISASACLFGWVNGVSSTGTFVKNPAMTSLPTGLSGIPSGWTVVNDGEESGGKPTNCLTLKPSLNKGDINVDFSFDFPPTSDLTVNLSIPNGLGKTTAQINFWKDVQSGSKNSIGMGTSTEIQILSYEPAEDDTYIYEIIIEQ
jgi:hypothetical protein